MNTRIAFALLLTYSSAQAVTFGDIMNVFNEEFGKVYFNKRNNSHKGGIATLPPEKEKLIREVVDQMNISQEIMIYKLHETDAALGTHTAYNYLYVEEKNFEMFSENPEVMQALIGHECTHIEKYHSLKWTTALVAPGLLLLYPMNKLLTYFKLLDKLPTWMGTKGPRLLANFIFLRGMASLSTTALVKPLMRQGEYDADQGSIKKLGNIFGHEKLVRGFASYFAKKMLTQPPKYSWKEKILATHPHSRDRLRKLGLPKEVSVKASKELLKIVKLRALKIARFCYADLAQQEEDLKELNEEDFGLYCTAFIVSVDPDVAKDCQKKLQEFSLAKTIEDLLNGIPVDGYSSEDIASLKMNNNAQPEEIKKTTDHVLDWVRLQLSQIDEMLEASV